MQLDTAFLIKHEQFEGPIEVLLELIEKRKLFVNDIPLASVTDDFVMYIKERGVHPESAASFLSVAATLILIKARSLLPTLELTTDEKESISDLERRVALYQVISDVSALLIKGYGKSISFEGVRKLDMTVFAPDTSLTLQKLTALVNDTLHRVPPPEPKAPEAHVYSTLSIRDIIDTLEARITSAISSSFSDIRVMSPDTDEKSQRVYTIVSFLGMLELVKQGLIVANQHELFDDIRLEKKKVFDMTPKTTLKPNEYDE